MKLYYTSSFIYWKICLIENLYCSKCVFEFIYFKIMKSSQEFLSVCSFCLFTSITNSISNQKFLIHLGFSKIKLKIIIKQTIRFRTWSMSISPFFFIFAITDQHFYEHKFEYSHLQFKTTNVIYRFIFLKRKLSRNLFSSFSRNVCNE